MASHTALRQGSPYAPDLTHLTAYPPLPPPTTDQQAPLRRKIGGWLGVVALIYLLISAVSILSTGFRTATGSQAEELFQFATNPFVGLMVGVVATALIQSSSTVTSIIVGLVAGGLPVSVAVPMVMGANIGTTVTNTLISLGYVRDKEEFKRAFSAATVHDFFNLLAVAIFLPLEIMFGFLERAALVLAEPLSGNTGYDVSDTNFVGAATAPVTGLVKDATGSLPDGIAGVAMLVVGMVMIFFSIRYVGKLLKALMVGRAKRMLHAAIGRGPISGIASGATVTVLVQSSTTSTSLMVPLAGSGALSLRQIYPFTLGANVGTTATALLASTAVSGPLAMYALEIALVHLLFNLLALTLIYSVPYLRNIPLRGAEWLASVAVVRKSYAIGWVAVTFLAVPGLLIFASTIF